MTVRSRRLRRPGRLARPALAVVLVLGASVSSGGALMAQRADSAGTIVGVVRDSSGAGIIGADVTVEGAAARAYSDVGGAFRLTGVPQGAVSVRVRRIGFRPAAAAVTVAPGATARLDVTVSAVAQNLTPVFVRARPQYMGPLAEFYRHRDGHGPGRFISRDEIDRRNPLRFTDLLRSVPGVQLVSTQRIPNAVRFRGQRCHPLVWLDGGKLNAAEFDVDLIDPNTVEGIEIYSSFTAVPPQYMGTWGEGNCGVIVVWTGFSERQRKRREQRQAKAQSMAADLARMVDSLQVYTADQVDTPARPDSSALANPSYPDSLYRAGVQGAVVAEFVVDTVGRVAMETVGVVSTTHPLFTDAVRQALPDARFYPAMRGGQRVRQVVQLPFRFETLTQHARHQ